MKDALLALWNLWQRIIEYISPLAQVLYPIRNRLLIASFVMLVLMFVLPVAFWAVGIGNVIENDPLVFLFAVSIPIIGFVWLTGLHVFAVWYDPKHGALTPAALERRYLPMRYFGHLLRQIGPAFLVFWMLSPIYLLIVSYFEIT